MIEPVGYDKFRQKFENEVYQTVKKLLGGKYQVEWSHEIYGLKPDVVSFLECNGCEYKKTDLPCFEPVFIFDAYCKFNIEVDYFNKKDQQMKKYSEICDSVLVMPQGYEQRPYCVRKNKEEYHIISIHYLPLLLESITSESITSLREDVCGNRPYCDTTNVFRHFELTIRSRIDRCPNCNSEVFAISLIYCSKYDEYYHPDNLDYDIDDHGIGDFTYVECDGCGDRALTGWNYYDCPFSSIEHKYQCKKCGVVFDPENKSIVKNFSL